MFWLKVFPFRDSISPLPAVSVCGCSLLSAQLERAAEELLDCWSTHESDGRISPNLPTRHKDGITRLKQQRSTTSQQAKLLAKLTGRTESASGNKMTQIIRSLSLTWISETCSELRMKSKKSSFLELNESTWKPSTDFRAATDNSFSRIQGSAEKNHWRNKQEHSEIKLSCKYVWIWYDQPQFTDQFLWLSAGPDHSLWLPGEADCSSDVFVLFWWVNTLLTVSGPADLQLTGTRTSCQAFRTCWDPPTFWRIVLDWLLEGGDVTEGAEKQDDFVLLVPDWSDLHEKPNWHPCSTKK